MAEVVDFKKNILFLSFYILCTFRSVPIVKSPFILRKARFLIKFFTDI